MNDRIFRTRDAHLTALLRCELGREAHTGIVFDDTDTGWFEFDRHPQCVAIMRAYYADGASKDFGPGYPVNDARALLREATAVRKELAIGRDKYKWRTERENQQ